MMAEKKIKVLIIDDDDVDKQAVKRALKSSGYNVELLSAQDIETGLLSAANNRFDCIILDYSLPGATGFEFMERYKSMNGKSPVIMVTSLGDEQLAVEAMKKGVCDYIPKSLITPEGIAQSMRYALKLNEIYEATSRIEQALQESERKLETVINNSPLILFSLDKHGIFTMFNGNGTKTLKFPIGQVIGKSIFDLGENLPVQLNDYLSACLGKDCSFKSKVNDRHFEVHFIPVRDHLQNLVEMMGVATDITGMKQTEEDLIKTITIAEESSKIKEQFMANMSHEIRTPVHGIMSLSDILSKTSLNQEQATYLNAIRRSTDNLLVIINDILDLSKIESGKMTFENTPFDFNEVLKMSHELFRHKAAEKNLELIYQINKNIPLVLKGDPVRLSQILNNLISNAIKFTEKGTVRLDVKSVENNKSSCVINFKVSDTGIGIPPQKISTIFETFTQAGNDITRKYGGTGLGLSIVKKLTELQGGIVTVESEINSGTTFSINLPLNYADINEQQFSEIYPEVQESILPDQLKILVVEDNEINQMIINKLLKDWGVTIENACNGIQAIDMIRNHQYNIVLMDIEMPEMNGYEATSVIRKDLSDPKNKIPILAMTAHASIKEKEKCFAAGMNDYISKPFDPSDVRKKIIQLTSGKQPQPFITDGIADILTSTEKLIDKIPSRYTNLSFLREMSDDNDSFIKDFIVLFLHNAPESIKMLQVHLKNKEWEAMRMLAHKIKPSFNYLGLKELYSAAATIEDYAKQGINLDEISALVEKIVNVCTIAFKELEADIKTLTV
jgi:PAS domain S-box-containing protein